ncbi:MAG: hypothetical protein JXP48_14020 [Acidobacteria bacterium]|nr:hypothetical protein [Acidobacteriota bacterium]
MSRNGMTLSLIILGCLLFLSQPNGSHAKSNEVLNAEKMVAAHVKSLGNPKTLAKIQSRTFVGTSEVKMIQGANWTLKGNSMFVSEGSKLGIVLQYLDVNYPGEYFAYDGADVTVKHISPGRKSPVADFLYRFDKIMKQGLLGGALSTSWPLLSEERTAAAQMKCRKVQLEGRELYVLDYRPKDGVGNMKIQIYFDPATFRHVRTEYRVQDRDDATVDHNYLEAAMTHIGDIGRAREDSFYKLVEKFDDYRNVGGMILPHRYILEYSQEGGAGSFIAHWTMNAQVWAFNPVLDRKLFQAEK